MSHPKRTRLGTFEVYREEGSPCILIRHVETGLRVGGFSHIAVGTFKAALEGLDEVEAELAAIQELGLVASRQPEALAHLQTMLRRTFPNGGWSRL